MFTFFNFITVFYYRKTGEAWLLVSAPPVFFLNPDTHERLSYIDICEAAEQVTGFESIVGVQRLGSLWRLYPANLEVRAKLAGTTLSLLGNISVRLCSQNPLMLRDSQGKEIATTRLSIDGIPVSVSSADIEGSLRQKGIKIRSAMMWEKARNSDNSLNNNRKIITTNQIR